MWAVFKPLLRWEEEEFKAAAGAGTSGDELVESEPGSTEDITGGIANFTRRSDEGGAVTDARTEAEAAAAAGSRFDGVVLIVDIL